MADNQEKQASRGRPRSIESVGYSARTGVRCGLGWASMHHRAHARSADALSRWGLVLAAVVGAGCPPATRPPEHAVAADDGALRFDIVEGPSQNFFYRQGEIAAHVQLRSGAHPRLLAAFPAGNSGAAIWFEDINEGEVATTFKVTSAPSAARETLTGAFGTAVSAAGVTFDVESDTPLQVEQLGLGSVRFLRSFDERGILDLPLMSEPFADGMRFQRCRQDGKACYFLALEARNGSRVVQDGTRLVLQPAEEAGPVHFRVQALTSEPALTPLGLDAVLRPEYLRGGARSGSGVGLERLRNVLDFLVYEEKWLAGSWRFLTYFGRDTLLTATLLAPALQNEAFEAALRSVISRLDDEGRVAHEETVGDFAVSQHFVGAIRADDSTLDYSMVDGDFMLAPVLARYMEGLEDSARATEFLGEIGAEEESLSLRLKRNFVWVLSRSAAFAKSGKTRDLIALESGSAVGDWRDSLEGLGGGVYAYSVNAVFVPAALEAIETLCGGALSDVCEELAGEAQKQLKRWRQAPARFEVKIPEVKAERALATYAEENGLSIDGAALDDQALSFAALALTKTGQPIAVMHNDIALRLLFNLLSPEEVMAICEALLANFPAGLRSGAGIVTANPAFVEDATLRLTFTRNHYHGAVVWGWQQTLILAGVRRQLERKDLPEEALQLLEDLYSEVVQLLEKNRAVAHSELWSWNTSAEGELYAVPFGSERDHRAESNPAQLWSTALLAYPASLE